LCFRRSRISAAFAGEWPAKSERARSIDSEGAPEKKFQ
jgi:hypothetical protein